jgi:hypothetical protein
MNGWRVSTGSPRAFRSCRTADPASDQQSKGPNDFVAFVLRSAGPPLPKPCWQNAQSPAVKAADRASE